VSRAPIIVTISDLRRDAARMVEKASRSREPLFITQRGYATAVLLSRDEYDIMCVLRDRGLRSINPRAVIDERRREPRDVETTAPGYWTTEPPLEFD
jgi:prevent-host-death family protein